MISSNYVRGGCQAYDISSGERVWSYPKWPSWRKSFPVELVDNTITCSRGERLDLSTGRLVDRRPLQNPVDGRVEILRPLIRDRELDIHRSELVDLIANCASGEPNSLTEKFGLHHHPPFGFRRAGNESNSWEISLDEIPYAWGIGYRSVCFRYPFFYFLTPHSVSKAGQGCLAEIKPHSYRFLSIDIRTGHVKQDIAVGQDLDYAFIADVNNQFIILAFCKFSGWRSSCVVALFTLC